MQQTASRRLSLGLSVVFHIILLTLLADSGLFSYLTNPHPVTMPLDVIYVTAASNDTEQPANASPSAAATSDISLPPKLQTAAKATANANRPLAATMASAGRPQATDAIGSKNNGQSTSGQGAAQGTDKGTSAVSNSGTASENASDKDADLIVETPPHLRNSVKPEYPEEMRQAGISGTVKIRATIGKAGSVEDLEILQSSGAAALDQAALDAFRQYSFSPAKNKHGQPVRCYMNQTFPFRLDD